MLHINELPCHHVLIKLDGPTTSSDGFSGPISKLLKKVNQFEFNSNFAKIDVEKLITIPEDILKNMSDDQKNCYSLHDAIRTGEFPRELQLIKCGKINHARWLTTGEALLMLYTRKHGLSQENSDKLKTIVHFAMSHYFKLYFEI